MVAGAGASRRLSDEEGRGGRPRIISYDDARFIVVAAGCRETLGRPFTYWELTQARSPGLAGIRIGQERRR